MAFEKSDLMFVCMLKPLSFEITVDQKEIQEAKVIKTLVMYQLIITKLKLLRITQSYVVQIIYVYKLMRHQSEKRNNGQHIKFVGIQASSIFE